MSPCFLMGINVIKKKIGPSITVKQKEKKKVNLAGPTLGTTDLGSIYISLKTHPAKQMSSDRVAEKRHTAVAVVYSSGIHTGSFKNFNQRIKAIFALVCI